MKLALGLKEIGMSTRDRQNVFINGPEIGSTVIEGLLERPIDHVMIDVIIANDNIAFVEERLAA